MLGKIYSVTFYLSVEDLSEENIAYMRTLRFPFLDFLVSSVQFSVNNKDYRRDFHLFDAPSKLDNAKHWRSTSANHASLALAFLGRFRRRPVAQSSSPCGSILGQVSPKCTDLRFMSFALSLILRKEVIQPHLPIRLPCYDFTPVTFPTLDGFAGFGCE